jgi:rsbT co-antagonist protein RsbR
MSEIAEILRLQDSDLLDRWMAVQMEKTAHAGRTVQQGELRQQCAEFLKLLGGATSGGVDGNTMSARWLPVREFLSQISRARARMGYSPSETAIFVFSLKQPLFALLNERLAGQPKQLAQETWKATRLLDELGLATVEDHQKGREEIISRQQRELLELSTPVVQLWEGILALPLIGTLDSERTQVVMESLLDRIVATGAGIAIIDITGVPTVDTVVAQHLLKTVAAARLMGADCIISGIRPQIAQTIVHLGVELGNVVTKATLADAFQVALSRTGMAIVKREANR